MEYLVALHRYRHFVTAAEKCGVTQPTLSSMIQKLEEELDVKIFDRSKHPVAPTRMGERIIRQAEIALAEAKKIKELVHDESENLTGELRLGIIPTLAPYIVPKFLRLFQHLFPGIDLRITEGRTGPMKGELFKGQIDILLAATPLEEPELLEIPLYYERFVAYFNEHDLPATAVISSRELPGDNLWVLQEGHCMRGQMFNFCGQSHPYIHAYEAGSIDTLVRIVDHDGGYSIIPELHIPYLTEAQQRNVRPLGEPMVMREISLVVKNDFIRERMLNAVADTLKKIIPAEMLNERLKKFAIKL